MVHSDVKKVVVELPSFLSDEEIEDFKQNSWAAWEDTSIPGIGHNQPPEDELDHPRTLAYEPPDSLHILACSRVALETILDIVPEKYYKAIADNAPNACCGTVKNLDIEAWYSCPTERDKGQPDIYKFYCNECNRCHVRFCIGGNHPLATPENIETHPHYHDFRPFWEIR